MSQQIINLGTGPDTQTGDSLYSAFAKVNNNFTELYSVFDGNSITTINANVIYSNNVVASANVRAGNIFTYGNLETIGYIVTSGIFYPNGSPIGGLGAIDSNIIPLTSNLYSIGTVTNQFTSGYFSTNIALAGANLTVVNGQLLLNGQQASGNYGNANVAAYLPTYTGILTASQINTTGNITVGNNLFANGNITYQNAVIGNLVIANTITASGNITAQYFLGNGRFLSGIDATSIQNGTSNVKVYYNSNVGITANGVTWNFDTTGNLTAPGNITTAANITASNFIGNFVGNISGNINGIGGNTQVLFNNNGTIEGNPDFTFNKFTNLVSISGLTISGNSTANGLTVNNSVTIGSTLGVTGNVVGSYFVGNGSALTSITGANVTGTVALATTATYVTGLTGTNVNVALGYVPLNSNATALTAQYVTQAAQANITSVGTLTGLTLSGALNGTAIQAATIGNSGALLTGSSLFVSGDAIVGNLGVLGNVTYINSNVTTILDPIIELNTAANGAPLTGTAPYDSGIKTHYWDGTVDRQSFFGRKNDNGNFEYYSNVISETGNVVIGTYGTIKTGNITLTGTGTIADTLVVGANTTVSNLTVNNSATVGTTLGVTGNATVGNILASGFFFANGTPLTTSAGGASGQVQFNSNGAFAGATSFTVNGSNVSVANLAVNSSITVGTTLGVSGNINGSSLTLTGSMISVGPTQHLGGLQATPIGNVTASTALFTTVSTSGNVTANALTVNTSATVGTTLGVTGNVIAGNVTTSGVIRTTSTLAATSNVTGAVQVSGGVGIAGNVYVGQRVGWVAANSVSVVYQVYNAATNSLDTIFG
jgi:hypothetical protein